MTRLQFILSGFTAAFGLLSWRKPAQAMQPSLVGECNVTNRDDDILLIGKYQYRGKVFARCWTIKAGDIQSIHAVGERMGEGFADSFRKNFPEDYAERVERLATDADRGRNSRCNDIGIDPEEYFIA